MRRIDMHIHTNASDGTFTPEEVLREAIDKNISIFAVSDHDTIQSVAETKRLAKQNNLLCVTAIEATSLFNDKEFHILGYNFDTDHPELIRFIENTSIIRQKREVDIIKGFSKLYDDISLSDFQDFSKQGNHGGGFLSLNYLKSKGKVQGLSDFFKLMKEHIQLPETYHFYDAQRVVDMFKSAGAVIVLAHPSYHFPGNVADSETLDAFYEMGIDGIECYSPYNSQPEQIEYYLDYCRKHALAISGGSDCHGPYLKREMGTPYVDESMCDIINKLNI